MYLTLEEMLKKPGLYVVNMPIGTLIVDVEAPGICHQCRPVKPYERDGILSNDGWLNKDQLLIKGPYERKT